MCNTVIITCILIYTLLILNITWCSCAENSSNNSTLMCKPSERAALLGFKHNLTSFDEYLSSPWEGEECCNWTGVSCDDTTGHILELDLGGHVFKMGKLEYSLVYLVELRHLESLDLSFNDFNSSSIPSFIGSMKQLRYLDLSSACLVGVIPYELGSLKRLTYLDLSVNSLDGVIPYELGNLANLQVLYLQYNLLSGEIPSSLGKLSNLTQLLLYDNMLSAIPTSLFGKLSMLTTLVIGYNPFEGTVLSEPDFANLTSLTMLSMFQTMLTLNLSSDWVPPFQLDTFYAGNINGPFPPWLHTQKYLSDLNLSNANIDGLIPSWFHTMRQLKRVDLSNNNLSGPPVFPSNFYLIILSNNSLSGDFLSNSSNTGVYEDASTVDLSDNFFSGQLLEGLGHKMPKLDTLLLSNNRISGQIPNSLCQLTSLTNLDIDNNSLSGEIPNCLANFKSLSLVRLSHNKLNGNVPCFNNSNSGEFYLHLNDNMLSGEIPSCWKDISNLFILDIGGNQLSGKMLNWFNSEKFIKLEILRLRGNNFSGIIPRQICSLPWLQLIDLGHNQFTGSIPRCLSNLTAMNSPINYMYYDSVDASEVIQGIERRYTSSLRYLVDIDLSCNNLVGSIPDDITKLYGLLSLNLSYNRLSGVIPENIGGLKSLISLDLSMNKLRGRIPTSIGGIPMLSYLNLSYNNLSGQVPSGNQLQVLSDQASVYAGNPYLCADFLPKKCKSTFHEQDKGRSDKGKHDNEKLEKMELVLVVMSGFASGFCSVVGSLALNSRWRHAFFRRVEDGYNWLYVIIVPRARMAKAKFNRR